MLLFALVFSLRFIFGGGLGVDGLSYAFDDLCSALCDLIGALERGDALYGELVVVVVAPAALRRVHDGSGLGGVAIDGRVHRIDGIHKLSLVALGTLHAE